MSSTLAGSPGLQTTLRSVVDCDEFRRVFNQLNSGARLVSISGLVAGARAGAGGPATSNTQAVRVGGSGATRSGKLGA